MVWAGYPFQWYNHERRHTGRALLPQAMVAYGRAEGLQEEHQEVLGPARPSQPERLAGSRPMPPELSDRGVDQPAEVRRTEPGAGGKVKGGRRGP